MTPALQRDRTIGWLRVELATVAVTEGELHELRERDVVLIDRRTLRSDRGESGPAVLVLHDGRRYQVSLELRSGSYFATVIQRCDEALASAAINLVHLQFDQREARAFESGSTFALNTVPNDSLVFTWRDPVVASGRFTEIEGELGVVIEALRT